MSIRLSEDEVWEFVEQSHTGILTTLRSDGHPIPLPVWFAVLEDGICIRTPAKTKKVRRVRRDTHASFLVEQGERWEELKAALLVGRVERIQDADREGRVAEALADKYKDARPDLGRLPERTRDHYSSKTATLVFVAEEAPISWDNSRLRRGDR